MFDADPTSQTPSTPVVTFTKGIFAASQLELEQLFSKYQLIDCLRAEVRAMGAEADLEACGIPVAFGIDLLVQMSLHKRAQPGVLVALLKRHFQDDPETGLSAAQQCADMLYKACAEDVIDWDPVGQQLVVIYDADDELQEKLDRFQFPLPMIEPPQQLRHNHQTGYLSIKGSVILKHNHHDDDVCLDHINRVNAQALKLNADVVAFVQNAWNDLDHRKDSETEEEFRDRQKAFRKYDKASKDVIWGLMAMSETFWLTHRYDKRGRTYCQGYHVTYQGNDWNKAVIEFADAEPLNEE